MKCNLCAKNCGAERDDEFGQGYCQMPLKIKIAHYELFKYEEPCISLNRGSGAIFFSGCSLGCVFCQNYDISTKQGGKYISALELANIFKELEELGAENINLVNPTHYVLGIIEALKIYKPNIPIIYNSHGYENEKTIELISPNVDVFLPDFKYYSNDIAEKFSNAKNYFSVSSRAIAKMIELKPYKFDGEKIMQGVIIRHMILPLCTNDSIKILEYIAKNFKGIKVSLMSQYVPYGRASEFPEINRRITQREYDKVLNRYLELNLDGYVQEITSASTEFIPKFKFI